MAYQPRRFKQIFVEIPMVILLENDETTTEIVRRPVGTIEMPRGLAGGCTTTPRINIKQEQLDCDIYLVGFNYYDFDSYTGMFEIVNGDFSGHFFFDSNEIVDKDEIELKPVTIPNGQHPYMWYVKQVEQRLA